LQKDILFLKNKAKTHTLLTTEKDAARLDLPVSIIKKAALFSLAPYIQ
jgi:tetraacyldisaccharide-1-P 4'-kinase